MIFLLAFSFLVTSARQGTIDYKECKETDFKMHACSNSKALHKTASALCKVQGKNFDGSSSCL